MGDPREMARGYPRGFNLRGSILCLALTLRRCQQFLLLTATPPCKEVVKQFLITINQCRIWLRNMSRIITGIRMFRERVWRRMWRWWDKGGGVETQRWVEAREILVVCILAGIMVSKKLHIVDWNHFAKQRRLEKGALPVRTGHGEPR